MSALRAEIVARRTYQRPLNETEDKYESWKDVCQRVVDHQRWLWSRALGRNLKTEELDELYELKDLMLNKQAMFGGRIMWMGGTEKIREREIASFNCSFLKIETVHDVVDALWLLLNGAGVGFKPQDGLLSGFSRYIPEIEVIRSKQSNRGRENNIETYEDGIWTISIGDSGEAWAKSVGKLLAGKCPAKKLVFDMSQIRPGGSRLKGYGWISSGDAVLSQELPKIAAILNKRSGRLLSKMDIMDVINHLGVIQTGRRGAEIALMDYGDPEWEEFASAKQDYWKNGNDHRSQSNNSLMFWEKPSREELTRLFDKMIAAGGSEPGIINAASAKRRSPWVAGFNPCNEILLPNKGLCNLCEINVGGFENTQELHRAVYLFGRANYRQTLVDLDDGILQRAWHETNEFLRLCGVSLTNWASRPDLTEHDMNMLRNIATSGAHSMAIELGTQLPKQVTCVKPSGTLSKVMSSKEGCHEALGKYIFNHITFSTSDPLVNRLMDAGYEAFPNGADGIAVRFPVHYPVGNFKEVSPGFWVNAETALDQLERYRKIMRNWCDQNCSITVSYKPEEVPAIVDWLDKNWDDYVGISFMLAQDPTKSAEDLGYPFLPQSVVSEDEYNAYVETLSEVDLDSGEDKVMDLVEVDECATGACPVR